MTAMIQRDQARGLAEGLGWFSIGLGLLEVAAARSMANGLGLRGQENLVRAYGVREIVTGIGILASRPEDRGPWLWGRVAGDALDMATLAAGMRQGGGGAAGLAMAAVLGVTVLDIVAAQAVSADARPRWIARDYSRRTGFARPVEELRGIARDDNAVPREYRTPDALAAWMPAD